MNCEADINALLLKLAFDGTSGIDQEDYKKLCIEGTVNVSEDEFSQLKQDNERFRELLKRHGISPNEEIEGPQKKE